MATQPAIRNPQSEIGSVYAVVLAGGSGQRFWPLSRERRPKQLLRFFEGPTLLEQTIARLEGLVPARNILVLTNHQQVGPVREVLRDFPAENIVAEPEKRDTGPAIALGVGWVASRDPEATMMVLSSDHLVRDRAGFQRTLRAAVEAARSSGALVTIGANPTWACPSYGYIERGARLLSAPGDVPVYEVKRFREKPSPEVAKQFLEQGGFAWNTGMFFWTLPAVRASLGQHCAELAEFVEALGNARDFSATLQERFTVLPKISIDYALLEKAERVLNVEAVFDWDDVGNWTSVGAYLPAGESGTRHNCALSEVDSANNLVFAETGQHVALLGVEDLVIISTSDALLVAHRSQAEKLKKLVENLPGELK